MCVCNFSPVISDKNPCKMFSIISCNYRFSHNKDNKNKTPLTSPVSPSENQVMKSKNFHGTLPSNNFAYCVKFCCSEEGCFNYSVLQTAAKVLWFISEVLKKYFFFRLYFNKKYIEIAVNNSTIHLIVSKWRQKRKNLEIFFQGNVWRDRARECILWVSRVTDFETCFSWHQTWWHLHGFNVCTGSAQKNSGYVTDYIYIMEWLPYNLEWMQSVTAKHEIYIKF